MRAAWTTASRSRRVVQRVEQRGEVLGVLLVERAVRAQVGERGVGQAEALLDAVGREQGERDAGAFEHVHHAEEADGVAALDRVPRVRHHHLGGGRGRAVAHRLGIAAGGRDVGEDPLVVARFLGDVLVERRAHPGEARRQVRAARFEQRHRVPDVVIGLREEREVARHGDLAAHRALDDRGGDEPGAVGGGGFLQLLVERHRGSWRFGWLEGAGVDRVDRRALRAAVRGGGAGGRREGDARAHPAGDARVVGQRARSPAARRGRGRRRACPASRARAPPTARARRRRTRPPASRRRSRAARSRPTRARRCARIR